MKAPPLVKSRQNRRTMRTPELRAHQDLGLAVGRLCVSSPEFRDDFTTGFSLALKEDTVGRRPDDVAKACAALLADQTSRGAGSSQLSCGCTVAGSGSLGSGIGAGSRAATASSNASAAIHSF